VAFGTDVKLPESDHAPVIAEFELPDGKRRTALAIIDTSSAGFSPFNKGARPMWTIAYETAHLVSRHRGTLPAILTCPYDGQESPLEVPERTGSALDCPPFSTSRDRHTRLITEGVAQSLLDTFDEAPYVVIAEFYRKYIDANCSPKCAYEDPDAKQYYDEYHNTIRNFVDEIRAENGGLGLLFDFHGTSVIVDDPADLYFGTADGDTIARLLRVDSQAQSRRRSLPGFLRAAGYVVSPQPGRPETPAVNGGYTVRTYGSSNGDGLDEIQIEIVSPLRDDEGKREALIKSLVYAISSLVPRYADSHTLAAFQRIDLFCSGVAQTVTGQLQSRHASNDLRPRLGGEPYNRGRIEIPHDPGSTGELAAPGRAGVLGLYDENGNDYYLWVDNECELHISPSDPGSNSRARTIVGAER
jgi:N-formylglutamate amidohydrolase